ncbi:MAG: hypothetical protein K0R20_1572 [Actinomycetia bacterium]|jgi:hypothetical protein|nr:hypothetical protein [Actinomycetes bacterium]
MSPMPRASRAQGDRTVLTGVLDGVRLLVLRRLLRGAAFLEGRERDPLPPDLREGEVFVAMCGQA